MRSNHLKKTSFFYTVRGKFLFVCGIFLVFSLLFFFIINLTLTNRQEELALSYSEGSLDIHQQWIDSDLQHITSFLLSFITDSENYFLLNQEDDFVRFQHENTIKSQLNNYLSTYDNASGIFFYYPETGTLLLCSTKKESYHDRRALKDYIRTLPQQKQLFSASKSKRPQIASWFPLALDNSIFLTEVISHQKVYLGSWLVEEQLLDPLNTIQNSTNGSFYLSFNNIDNPVYYPLSLNNEKINENLHLPENSLHISSTSAFGNFQLTLAIPRFDLLQESWFFQQIIILIFFFTLLIISTLLLTAWKQMLKPIETLVQGMQSIQSGDFTTRLPPPKYNDEFAQVSETFNKMTEKIQTLKMQIYEEKLAKTRTELQYLTLQIKPHFFLNSLNLICSMAATGRINLITDITTCLIKYFRYALHDFTQLVSLQEELEHTKNYLHIQELRLVSKFYLENTSDKKIMNLPIPILTIQTFVENSIKHGFNRKEKLILKLNIRKLTLSAMDYIEILICDNGPGFSTVALEKLNQFNQGAPIGTKQIGIENVKRRLYYIYHETAILKFYNDPRTGGAIVCLLLPIKQSKEIE